MRIGQNCTRLKTLSKFILLGTIFNCANYQIYPQAYPPKENNQSLRKLFQPENPLKLCWGLLDENFDADKSASDNESLFLPTTDSRIISINSKTGFKNWDTNFGGQLKTAVNVSEWENAVFIASNTKSDRNLTEVSSNAENGDNLIWYTIRRLDKETGVVIWQTGVPIKQGNSKNTNSDEDSINLYSLSGKLIVSTNSGEFYLINSANGKVQRQISFRGGISAVPSSTDGQTVTLASEQRVYVLSASDLSKIVEVEIKGKPNILLKLGERLVWGDNHGTVNLMSFTNGSSVKKADGWKLRTGGEILSIKSVENSLVIASLDNYVYSVSINGGKLSWKIRLSNRPAFDPLVIGHYAALTTVGDSTVLFVETKTGRTINKIDPGENFFYTRAPQVIGSMIIFSTGRGFSAYTSDKNCGG